MTVLVTCSRHQSDSFTIPSLVLEPTKNQLKPQMDVALQRLNSNRMKFLLVLVLDLVGSTVFWIYDYEDEDEDENSCIL